MMISSLKKFDVCLVGYYGMKNCGDDALLMATMLGAKSSFSAKYFTATTASEIKYPNLQQLPATVDDNQHYRGQNRLQRYWQAVRSKVVIFGGGSVFHTAQDIRIKSHLMTLAGNSRHVALGVGLGPFQNKQAEIACQKFLKRSSFVGLRDEHSFAIASELAPDANFSLTYDLAPTLLSHSDFQLKCLPRSGIAICLCPWERFHGDEMSEILRIERMAEVLIGVAKESSEVVHLISMNGHDKWGDDAINQSLYEKISPYVPVRMIAYDANPLRVLQRLATYKVAVSMRLHGSILAHLVGTPCISISYHDKCTAWAERVGVPSGHCLNAENLDVETLAETLLNGLEIGFEDNLWSISDAKSAAGKNWSAVK